MKKNIKYIIGSVTASFLIGCGGGSSGNNTTSTPSFQTTLTVVDPYIVGATIFWDKNANGIKDIGEPESTSTNQNGQAVMTTDAAIPTGAILVMNTKGKHGGVDYTGTLKAKYNVNGVISPLTTLEVAGFTKAQIVNLLGGSITEADIIKNPMENIRSTTTSVTEADLKLIKANMAVNTFLSTNGFSTTSTTLNANSADLTSSLNLMDILITPSNITSTNNALNVVKAALAINNYALLQSDVRGAVSSLATGVNRDTYFNSLLTSLATNSDTNVKLENDGTVSEVFTYSMNEYISDLKTKSSFSIEYGSARDTYNTNYMSYWDSTGYYEYDYYDGQNKYPNSDEPNFTLEAKKIDETHFGNYLNGALNDNCEILSYRKVRDIIGVAVNAIEVKSFCVYQDEWEDVTSEFGTDRPYYNFPSTFTDIFNFKDVLIEKNVWMGEEGIYLQSDNTLKDRYNNSVSGSWIIEDNILKIKYYDEIWFKLENNKVMEFWKADTQFTYVGVTKAQTNSIAKTINPTISIFSN